MNFFSQKLKLRFSLNLFFFIVSGVLVTYTVSNQLSSADYLNLDVKFTTPLLLIPFSFSCYILSVLLRGLRLYLFTPSVKHKFRTLFKKQFLSTCFQLLLPFRIGDIVRIYLFRNYLNGLSESSLVFLVEKLFDLAVLFFMISYFVFFGSFDLKFISFLSKSNIPLLILLIVSSVFVIPFFANVIYRYILTSELTSRKRALLPVFYSLIITQDALYSRIRKTFLVSLFLTYLIWVFDCLSFSFIVLSLKLNLLSSLLLGPLVSLSSFFPSPPLGISGSVSVGFYWFQKALNMSDALQYSLIYSLYIYANFCVCTLIMFCLFKFFRIKNFKLKC